MLHHPFPWSWQRTKQKGQVILILAFYSGGDKREKDRQKEENQRRKGLRSTHTLKVFFFSRSFCLSSDWANEAACTKQEPPWKFLTEYERVFWQGHSSFSHEASSLKSPFSQGRRDLSKSHHSWSALRNDGGARKGGWQAEPEQQFASPNFIS